jgi:hypothetical protein
MALASSVRVTISVKPQDYWEPERRFFHPLDAAGDMGLPSQNRRIIADFGTFRQPAIPHTN